MSGPGRAVVLLLFLLLLLLLLYPGVAAPARNKAISFHQLLSDVGNMWGVQLLLSIGTGSKKIPK